MSQTESGIYTGTLRHRRFSPVWHDFTYPLFMVFLDIDRIPELTQISPFLSYNRWNWATFDERDHFGNPRLPLRQRIEADAAEAGVALPAGPIYLLTHLRYLGYCFNPVSFFYCYSPSGELDVVLAEVNSTFGETRNYWLPTQAQKPRGECPPFPHAQDDARLAFHGDGPRIRFHPHSAQRGSGRTHEYTPAWQGFL